MPSSIKSDPKLVAITPRLSRMARHMRPEFRDRWEMEIRKRTEPFQKPKDLLLRATASEDVVDTAVIGGVEVVDILAGKIAESQIPSNVLAAFHAYGTSFVEASSESPKIHAPSFLDLDVRIRRDNVSGGEADDF
jgi:hypothetical protein